MQDDDEMAGENRSVRTQGEECRNLGLAFGARVSAPQEAFAEAEQKERRAAMPAIFAKTPFLSWLGLVVERYEPDDVATRLPFRLELSNDGSTYHGGVVGAVIDTTGAPAAWSNHDFDRGMRASTVSMALQYVAGSAGGDLLCAAHTVRRARELIFTEITATDEAGKVLAHGLQTYRIA
jgi:uncharacterized protein (TIGR00369 family)